MSSTQSVQIVVACAAFFVEAVLLAVAVVHMRSGRFAPVIRWAARVLVLGMVAMAAISVYEAVWEITTFHYPWTLPGRPFGTYAQPTVLGVGMVAVDGFLFATAGAVAFFRARVAAALLALIALFGMASALRWLSDPTAPPWNWALALIVGPPLPALTVSAVLRSLDQPLFGSQQAE